MSKTILYFLLHCCICCGRILPDGLTWEAEIEMEAGTKFEESDDVEVVPADLGFIFKAKKRLTRMLVLLCHTLDYGTSTADAAPK